MKALKAFYGETLESGNKKYYRPGDIITCKDKKLIGDWVKLGLMEKPKAEKKAAPKKAKKEGTPPGAKK